MCIYSNNLSVRAGIFGYEVKILLAILKYGSIVLIIQKSNLNFISLIEVHNVAFLKPIIL